MIFMILALPFVGMLWTLHKKYILYFFLAYQNPEEDGGNMMMDILMSQTC